MVANATAGGTLLADGIGWGNTLNARRVEMLILLVFAFGAVVTAVASTPPVELIVAVRAMAVLVAPLLGVLLVILANNRRLTGDMRNRAWQNTSAPWG
jgi:manganese transport protein